MQSGLNSGLGRFVRIERHPLGARLHLAGFRFHEWHLGSAILLALGAGAALGRVDDNLTAALAGFGGVWLVAKDWHDLVPSRRDTAAWKLGLHRRPNPLRTFRRADPLPALAAIGAILVAIVNLVSALTPNMAWRGHALLKLEPLAAMRVSHALAIPVAWLLLVAGVYLGRRRRRALQLAIVLLVVLAALNILKGLDVEEAVMCAARQSSGDLVGLSHLVASFVTFSQGDAAGCTRHALAMLDIASKVGSPLQETTGFHALGSAHVLDANWDEAIRALERSLAAK